MLLLPCQDKDQSETHEINEGDAVNTTMLTSNSMCQKGIQISIVLLQLCKNAHITIKNTLNIKFDENEKAYSAIFTKVSFLPQI